MLNKETALVVLPELNTWRGLAKPRLAIFPFKEV
jgi:hypothetical protein